MLLGSRLRLSQPCRLARGCSSSSRKQLPAVAAVKSSQPPPTLSMAAPGEAVSLRGELSGLFKTALSTAFPSVDEQPLVAPCNNPTHGDYQCNNSMSLFGKLKGKEGAPKNPREVATAILGSLPPNSTIADTSLAGPGFINVKVNNDYLATRLRQMLAKGVSVMAPTLRYKRVVVDFSSPNVAKEMHVGHLRSTIIGDTICRWVGVEGGDAWWAGARVPPHPSHTYTSASLTRTHISRGKQAPEVGPPRVTSRWC